MATFGRKRSQKSRLFGGSIGVELGRSCWPACGMLTKNELVPIPLRSTMFTCGVYAVPDSDTALGSESCCSAAACCTSSWFRNVESHSVPHRDPLRAASVSQAAHKGSELGAAQGQPQSSSPPTSGWPPSSPCAPSGIRCLPACPVASILRTMILLV